MNIPLNAKESIYSIFFSSPIDPYMKKSALLGNKIPDRALLYSGKYSTFATDSFSMIDYLLNNYLEIVGTVVGIFYLYWEYKGDIKLWIASIIMPAISLYVYYHAGLYADFGINIYYFLVAVYGWIIWRFGIKTSNGEQHDLRITFTPRKVYLSLAVVFAVLWVGIGELLIHATNSTVPWLDAFTTALSIVGMWMLARKWIEQWWSWLLVDAVSTGLYIYKGIYFYAALYALYTVIIFFGYRKWKQLMKEGK